MTALVSALTALAAVVLAPLVSIYVVRKEVTASTVSQNRQAWINRLRDEVALFVRIAKNAPSAYAAKIIALDEAVHQFDLLTQAEQTIRLLVNPGESEHTKLLGHLAKTREIVLNAINRGKGLAKDIDGECDSVIDCTQKILKSEWQRVKAGG